MRGFEITDDAILYGSLAAFAIGAALVVAGFTGHALLAAGTALVAFGVPSAVVVFLASVEESK